MPPKRRKTGIKFKYDERLFVIERIIAKKDVVECDNPTFSQNQQKMQFSKK